MKHIRSTNLQQPEVNAKEPEGLQLSTKQPLESVLWQRKENITRGSGAFRFTIWRPCPGISETERRRPRIERHWGPTGAPGARRKVNSGPCLPTKNAWLAPGGHEHATGVPMEKLFVRRHKCAAARTL